MTQKRLMLLGGLRYLLPVIEAAHKEGYYVITADYLPDNIAHKYSDEYCNVSVIDKDAVLEAAKRLNIDGIMSFAVDPGVVAASYVQNQLGLPSFGPYESVCILQNKGKFRKFLTENGFNVPKARSYSSKKAAMEDSQWYEWPMIVKPTDSAGSKGVTRIDTLEQLPAALDEAFNNSISGTVIVEQFLEKDGCSSDTDSFLLEGKLKFVSFSAQRFDENAENPYTPSAYSWPSTFTASQEEYLTNELERLFTLLGMKTSIFNIETRISRGIPYIMEATPRGGGNRLAEMLKLATGVDMITACVRAAVGDPIYNIEQKPYNGHWAEIVIHSDKDGQFKGLEIQENMRKYLVETELRVKENQQIHSFRGANDAIGTLVMKFPNAQSLEKALRSQQEWIKVKVE